MRFKTCEKPLRYSNLSQHEWRAVGSLADDRNIVIKTADEGHVQQYGTVVTMLWKHRNSLMIQKYHSKNLIPKLTDFL